MFRFRKAPYVETFQVNVSSGVAKFKTVSAIFFPAELERYLKHSPTLSAIITVRIDGDCHATTNPTVTTIGLLVHSNIFMTFAWYGHLKHLKGSAVFVAILASWGIAFFEYMLMVPANRIGSTVFSLAQLKILQEVITLSVFIPFAVLYTQTT